MKFVQLKPPHGFLFQREKKKAIVSDKPLPTGEKLAVVCDGQIYGWVVLLEPSVTDAKVFDNVNDNNHGVKPHERRLWWPDADILYTHGFEDFKIYTNEVPCTIEGGEVHRKDKVKLTGRDKALAGRARNMPSKIVLNKNVLTIDTTGRILGEDYLIDNIEPVLTAVFEKPFERAKDGSKNLLPLYDLMLVRKPILYFTNTPGDVCIDCFNPIRSSEMTQKNAQKAIPEASQIFEIREVDEGLAVWDARTNKPVQIYLIDDRHPATDAMDRAQMLMVTLAENLSDEMIQTARGIVDGMNEPPIEGEMPMEGEMPPEDMPVEDVIDEMPPPDEVSPEDVAEEIIDENPDEEIVDNIEEQLDEMDEEEDDEEVKQFDDSPWDGSAGQWPDAESYCSDCLLDFNPVGAEKVKGLCRLPYRAPGKENPNANAIKAIGGGARGITAIKKPAEISQEDFDQKMTAAANKVIGWWPKLFENPAPEGVYKVAGKPRPDEKIGRRLKTAWLSKLKEFGDMLKEMIAWAEGPEAKQFEIKQPQGVGIKYQKDGPPIFFTWSANAFRDREGEIFTTNALKQYVIENMVSENKGSFNLWHIPGTDFATKTFQAVVGRILIEAGPFNDTPLGQKALEFFENYPNGHPSLAPDGWGASVEYRYFPGEREKGIYEWVWITRTSVLGRDSAANPYTIGGIKMTELTDVQKQAGTAVFGEELFETIVKAAEKATELLEQEVDFKSAPQAEEDKNEDPAPEGEGEPEAVDNKPKGEVEGEQNVDTPAEDEGSEGGEKQEVIIANAITKALEPIVASVSAIAERVKTIEEGGKLIDRNSTARWAMFANTAGQKASESDSTKVDDKNVPSGPAADLPQGAQAYFPKRK